MLLRPLVALCGAALVAVACGSSSPAPGAEVDVPPAADTAAEATADDAAPTRQILFGDLHVHSTFSTDAALLNTPILAGNGLAGPALRCDYARFCSQLDFWSITDHPEGVLPEKWAQTKEAIRVCNDLEGGDGADPDLVSFLGWEWTQSADSPGASWGHKNVILLDTAEEDVPARPIAATSGAFTAADSTVLATAVALATNLDPDNTPLYDELGAQLIGGAGSPACEAGVDTRDLPADCRETAEEPAELYEKLDQWGFPAVVIPHGTTWGTHNPAMSSWELQLDPAQHDPDYERLVEVYSGHGNMEQWRPWVHAVPGEDGGPTCPAPSEDGAFEPCCWRAGEITRARAEPCLADAESDACEAAVVAARQLYLDEVFQGVNTVGETTGDDWGECGQCTDCFQPAFTHRPGFTTQGALARSWFGEDGQVLRYHWGFIGSTDSHAAGPGAGFKEVKTMADIYGPGGDEFHDLFELGISFVFTEWERQNAYFYSGGLMAVHADGRDRQAIWDAMQRREVYATSGERMLLWFDLLDEAGGRLPMGSRAAWPGSAPTFEVRAVGAFAQTPGCPDEVVDAAPEGFIAEACLGECYHPTDERRLITRLEIVKVTPQVTPDEPLAGLIQDPWLVLDCDPDPEGCAHTFSDDDFGAAGRPALYYARAIQEPTPQVNAENLRCERDADGACVAVHACLRGPNGAGDDCLGPGEERAWSSPIYLDPQPQ